MKLDRGYGENRNAVVVCIILVLNNNGCVNYRGSNKAGVLRVVGAV